MYTKFVISLILATATAESIMPARELKKSEDELKSSKGQAFTNLQLQIDSLLALVEAQQDAIDALNDADFESKIDALQVEIDDRGCQPVLDYYYQNPA